jgi:hypothetical protein
MRDRAAAVVGAEEADQQIDDIRSSIVTLELV